MNKTSFVIELFSVDHGNTSYITYTIPTGWGCFWASSYVPILKVEATLVGHTQGHKRIAVSLIIVLSRTNWRDLWLCLMLQRKIYLYQEYELARCVTWVHYQRIPLLPYRLLPYLFLGLMKRGCYKELWYRRLRGEERDAFFTLAASKSFLMKLEENDVGILAGTFYLLVQNKAFFLLDLFIWLEPQPCTV